MPSIITEHLFPRKQSPYNNSSGSPIFAHQDQHKFRWVGTATFKYITFNCELTLKSKCGFGRWSFSAKKKEVKKTSSSSLHLRGPHSGVWSAPLLCAAKLTYVIQVVLLQTNLNLAKLSEALPHPDRNLHSVVVIKGELSTHPRKGLAGRHQGAWQGNMWQHWVSTCCSPSVGGQRDSSLHYTKPRDFQELSVYIQMNMDLKIS